MCMQPWFFSIGRRHLGQGLVLAIIQCTFSLSALFFVIHCRTSSHDTCRCGACLASFLACMLCKPLSPRTGLCASCLQPKQKHAPQTLQPTSSGSSVPRSMPASTATSQPFPTHLQRTCSCVCQEYFHSKYITHSFVAPPAHTPVVFHERPQRECLKALQVLLVACGAQHVVGHLRAQDTMAASSSLSRLACFNSNLPLTHAPHLGVGQRRSRQAGPPAIALRTYPCQQTWEEEERGCNLVTD
jgi:hypothetical protein